MRSQWQPRASTVYTRILSARVKLLEIPRLFKLSTTHDSRLRMPKSWVFLALQYTHAQLETVNSLKSLTVSDSISLSLKLTMYTRMEASRKWQLVVTQLVSRLFYLAASLVSGLGWVAAIRSGGGHFSLSKAHQAHVALGASLLNIEAVPIVQPGGHRWTFTNPLKSGSRLESTHERSTPLTCAMSSFALFSSLCYE